MEETYQELFLLISDTCVGYKVTDVVLASMLILYRAIQRIEEAEIQKCLVLTMMGLLEDFRENEN